MKRLEGVKDTLRAQAVKIGIMPSSRRRVGARTHHLQSLCRSEISKHLQDLLRF